MDKFFFSDKNVTRQCSSLERLLNIENNPESKRQYKKFLVQQMKDVFNKYGKRKPQTMKAPEFLDLLNKKSIRECVKIIEDKKNNKKKQYSSSQIGEYERSRAQEIHGNREIKVARRPQNTSINKNQGGNNTNNNPNNSSTLGFNDGSNANGFAPIPQGNGEYITATGEMGSKMIFGNLEDQMFGRRSDSKDDLERMMMDRANQYDNRSPMGGGGMPNMGGLGQGGFDQLNGNMMNPFGNDFVNPMMRMAPNTNPNGGPPQEIDFTLVQGKQKRDANSYKMDQNILGKNNMGFTGIDSMGLGGIDNMGLFNQNNNSALNEMNMYNSNMMNPNIMMNQNMMNANMMNPNMMNPNMNPNMMNQNMNPNMMNPNMNPNMMNQSMHQNMGIMNSNMINPNMGGFNQNIGSNSNMNGMNPNMGGIIPNINNDLSSNFDMGNLNSSVNQNNNAFSDSELSSNLNKMLAEREKLDSNNKNQMINNGANKNFNPMISPSMMNNNMMGNFNNLDLNQVLAMQKMHEMRISGNNHLNYNRGTQYMTNNTESEPLKNLDSELLEIYIKKMKDNIYNQMNLSNLNPIFLQSLDAKQLDELIKKISLDLSGLNNIVNEKKIEESKPKEIKSEKKEENKKKYRENFEETFKNLEMNLQENISLKNNNEIDPQMEIFLTNNRQNLTNLEQSFNLSKLNSMAFVEDLPLENKNIILIDDTKNPLNQNLNNFKQQNNIPNESNNINLINKKPVIDTIQYKDILIKSDDYVEPENYNDYMVDFKNEYNKIVSFQLINIKFPEINNLINEYNNDILIIIEDEEFNDKLEPSIYNLQSLLNMIKQRINTDFEIKMSNENHIILINTKEKNFDLINRGNSVFKQLGFIKSKYMGKNNYVAEELPQFGNKIDIHLFVEGIDDEKPLLSFDSTIDPNKLCPINITFQKPIESLPEIFIKFKSNLNPDLNNFTDFYGQPHELLFRIGILN